MNREAFIAKAWDVVGRKVAKERLLTDIYKTAKTSVGLPIGSDSDAVSMFRLVLGEGRDLIAQRNQIERRAVELLKDLPDYQLLTSVPGIGPINALTIRGRGHPCHRWIGKGDQIDDGRDNIVQRVMARSATVGRSASVLFKLQSLNYGRC